MLTLLHGQPHFASQAKSQDRRQRMEWHRVGSSGSERLIVEDISDPQAVHSETQTSTQHPGLKNPPCPGISGPSSSLREPSTSHRLSVGSPTTSMTFGCRGLWNKGQVSRGLDTVQKGLNPNGFEARDVNRAGTHPERMPNTRLDVAIMNFVHLFRLRCGAFTLFPCKVKSMTTGLHSPAICSSQGTNLVFGP